jgi:hypothetical protein
MFHLLSVGGYKITVENILKFTTEFHSHLDICKKHLLASEYENISKRLNDISAMQSLALNKRQRIMDTSYW